MMVWAEKKECIKEISETFTKLGLPTLPEQFWRQCVGLGLDPSKALDAVKEIYANEYFLGWSEFCFWLQPLTLVCSDDEMIRGLADYGLRGIAEDLDLSILVKIEL